tara:strand:- start:271 stop:432 length:162 start_codon:yes stop_codon:yes gene_type:complete
MSIDLNKCIRFISEKESTLIGLGNAIFYCHAIDYDDKRKLDLVNQIFGILTFK